MEWAGIESWKYFWKDDMPKKHEHPNETYHVELDGHELNVIQAALECYADMQEEEAKVSKLIDTFNTSKEIKKRARDLLKKISGLWDRH